eukprot:scaffold8103_cov403-Prasinococcus_capsulatus_cf.AAC.1
MAESARGLRRSEHEKAREELEEDLVALRKEKMEKMEAELGALRRQREMAMNQELLSLKRDREATMGMLMKKLATERKDKAVNVQSTDRTLRDRRQILRNELDEEEQTIVAKERKARSPYRHPWKRLHNISSSTELP